MKHQQSRDEAEGQAAGDGETAQAQKMAGANQRVHAIELFAPQDHVQIALGFVGRGNGRDGKRFAPVVTAGVVSEDGKVRPTTQKVMDGFERNVFSFDFFRVCREGQNAPLQIQKIDFDTRVDDHVLVEGLFQRGVVDAALLDEISVGDQVPGKVEVEVLVHFREVASRGGDAYHGVDDAHGGEQQHQNKRQLGVK
jgi:hypothetical protein